MNRDSIIESIKKAIQSFTNIEVCPMRVGLENACFIFARNLNCYLLFLKQEKFKDLSLSRIIKGGCDTKNFNASKNQMQKMMMATIMNNSIGNNQIPTTTTTSSSPACRRPPTPKFFRENRRQYVITYTY